jgi:hypothetical protein
MALLLSSSLLFFLLSFSFSSPLPQFLLHIGPHKTASTFFQDSLSNNKEIIQKYGYRVLSRRKSGAVFAFTLKHFAGQRGVSSEFLSQVNEFVDMNQVIEHRNESLILSSEELDDLGSYAIEHLRHIVTGYNTTIVFFHRNRFDLIRSTWDQLTYSNCSLEFPAFLFDRVYGNNSDFAGLEMTQTLRRYSKAFGRESLHVISYDALRMLRIDPLTFVFNEVLGIRDIPLSTSALPVNESPKSDLVNRLCPSLRENKFRFFRPASASLMLETKLPMACKPMMGFVLSFHKKDRELFQEFGLPLAYHDAFQSHLLPLSDPIFCTLDWTDIINNQNYVAIIQKMVEMYFRGKIPVDGTKVILQ